MNYNRAYEFQQNYFQQGSISKFESHQSWSYMIEAAVIKSAWLKGSYMRWTMINGVAFFFFFPVYSDLNLTGLCKNGAQARII